ncbi:MAG: ParB N-terminal domain-containing protein [Chloroflexi bacterium]|nr:ParB N-terminal domain-containing protein [Chloroflexota bacterium]
MSSYTKEATFEVPPPELRILPVKSLLPHEEFDVQRVEPLMHRIEDAGIWLHPPIVTPLPDSEHEYVVLDGANRCHAMSQLDYPHILVQVVDYNSAQVELDTWNHVIANLETSTIVSSIQELAGVDIQSSDRLSAQAAVAQRIALAFLIDLQTQDTYVMRAQADAGQNATAMLRQIVNQYKDRCMLERINTDDVEHVLQMFQEATTLVVFPHYEPSEVLYAARERNLLPPGISRHIIHGRAMRLIYPLQALRDSKTSLERKNADLQEWVNRRIQQHAVRYYAESIYTFDD